MRFLSFSSGSCGNCGNTFGGNGRIEGHHRRVETGENGWG